MSDRFAEIRRRVANLDNPPAKLGYAGALYELLENAEADLRWVVENFGKV